MLRETDFLFCSVAVQCNGLEFCDTVGPWAVQATLQSSHLARCFDSFPDAEVDNGEDEHDTKGQLPADGPQVLESLRLVDLQDVAPGVTKRRASGGSPEHKIGIPLEDNGHHGGEGRLEWVSLILKGQVANSLDGPHRSITGASVQSQTTCLFSVA